MNILIRDNNTNEVMHTISVDADDDRRDDIVKAVLDQFPPDSVYVDDEPSAALTGDAHARTTDDDAEAALSPIGGDDDDDGDEPT